MMFYAGRLSEVLATVHVPLATCRRCCRARRVDVSDPIPGDAVFRRAAEGEFDAVIACYHDQGLMPIPKLIGKMVERGFTLVPVRMYFRKGLVKVTVGVAKGKKTYDKRESPAPPAFARWWPTCVPA